MQDDLEHHQTADINVERDSRSPPIYSPYGCKRRGRVLARAKRASIVVR